MKTGRKTKVPSPFYNHRGRGGLPMAGVVDVGGNRHGGREWLLGGDCFRKFLIAFTEIPASCRNTTPTVLEF